MRILIALDTDGIFQTKEIDSDYVSGPIDVHKFQDMIENWSVDNMIKVVTVSESPFYPKTELGQPVFELINTKSRYENLRDAKEKYPSDLYLYISDNGWDKKDAENADFIYITEKQALKLL